ncbi:MAG: acetylglutamate kinase [Firmicutes bacterium]|nr:acetylglutamate kinase [Bacillota bacterium]
MEPLQKAGILVEALPYIRKFSGKTVVIKYGGNVMLGDHLKLAVAQDIVLLRYIGLNPIVVHGGGPEINALMERLGKKPSFVNGLRVTDAESMGIVQMVLAGKVNKDLVSLLGQCGGKAVGLCGVDAGLMEATRLSPELGFVGKVSRVNPGILQDLSAAGYIPVVSTIALGEGGESYNINADSAAAELAVALGAAKLIMLTDVEGIYEDPGDRGSLVSVLDARRAREMIAAGMIAGGMIPKVEACIRAAEGGVNRTHIIDGRVPHSVLLEVFTDTGVGTMVVA